MAQIGQKAQGQDTNQKRAVIRHGSKRGRSKSSVNANEKAIETRVRQAGKKICRDWS